MTGVGAGFLASDAAWAEGAGVGAEFFECVGERFDVAVAEVLGEVLFDRVAVVAASLLHCRAALVGEDDEDRVAVVFGADSLDEAGPSSRSTTRVKPLLL